MLKVVEIVVQLVVVFNDARPQLGIPFILQQFLFHLVDHGESHDGVEFHVVADVLQLGHVQQLADELKVLEDQLLLGVGEEVPQAGIPPEQPHSLEHVPNEENVFHGDYFYISVEELETL